MLLECECQTPLSPEFKEECANAPSRLRHGSDLNLLALRSTQLSSQPVLRTLSALSITYMAHGTNLQCFPITNFPPT